jgi:hypothetical protein
VRLSTATDCLDDFNAIAVAQFGLSMQRAWNDIAIDLGGQPLSGQLKMFNKRGDAAGVGWQTERLSIEYNGHVRV